MSNDVNSFCIHHPTLTRLDGVPMMNYYFHRFPTNKNHTVAGGNRSICGPQERMLILLSFYVSLFGHASLALSASGALSEVCANCSWRTQRWREVCVQRNLQMHESMISSWWLGRLALYIVTFGALILLRSKWQIAVSSGIIILHLDSPWSSSSARRKAHGSLSARIGFGISGSIAIWGM